VVPASRAQISLSFAPIVRETAPAVVNIYARRVVRTAGSPFFTDPFFRQFFGGALPEGPARQRVENSLGSGVIVDADGTVVTNHHVIAGAEKITVVLPDHREFKAKLVGDDPRADLAVLKIDPKGQKLPVLPFGDSDHLEVGDLVLAVGDPFGVGQTVTMGIVSALARTNVGVSDYRSFIQTDAAINPGNSGGALVDMRGHLVGINSAIYSKSGGSVGIGFAIPSSLVKAVLAAIRHNGKVVPPYIGIGGQTVTPDIARAMHLARPVGILINRVDRGGPAARAGLKPGDVVTAIDGRETDDMAGLQFRLATLALGSEARFDILRHGARQVVAVRLVAPPEVPPRDPTTIKGANPLAGATLANLNPALDQDLGMGTQRRGVVVDRVRPGSVAERFQFSRGDVVVAVNGARVRSVAEAAAALAIRPETWHLTVDRGGRTMTLVIGG
jgi:serine protease Do